MNKKIILSFLLIGWMSASGQLKLPAIISNNMALQRNISIPVWGWAAEMEKITVLFKNKTYNVQADNSGKWLLFLEPSRAGGPFQMSIYTKHDTIVITNIVVGDVWLASGQSNMEFGIQTERNGEEAIRTATDSLIRMFYVPMASSLQPENDVAPVPAGSLNGRWIVCSPKVMAEPRWAWHGFSAAGYYFARDIRKSARVPVGMIASYKGGTPAQAWTSIDGLKEDTIFSRYILAHQRLVDNYDQAKKDYPQKQAAYEAAMEKWKTDAANKTKPPAPPSPDGGFSAPGNLYNAMIYPLIPYAIKGVIWYQGESNGDRITDARQYEVLFSRMIQDWRRVWKQGDFAFLFVQLASFRAPAKSPSEGIWPWVREAQLHTLSLPNTGMAVTTDIGDANDIHPKNKLDVGLRLAYAARHVVYKEKLTYSGPIYQSMSISGNKIRLQFSSVGRGLVASGNDPELKGFGIAGPDGKFVWAKAIIQRNSVIVYSDQVSNPVAVRYNWADNPPGNLFNKNGLPASPFRTDTWQE